MLQRGYTFDVKPRWNLAEQNEPEPACAAGLS